jgi:VCBS repeat-containing protein
MSYISKKIVLLWLFLIMATPCSGQDFNKQIPNRMTSAGSGFGTGETVDMRVLIGQPVPGTVGNGQSFQVRTNAEDMLTRRLNYTLVANAGLDQSTVEGDNVSLDASLSYDPANAIVKYQWIQLSGPNVELDDSASITPQFIAPEVSIFGAYLVFQLTVFNSNNVSAQDTVKIFVKNEIKNFIITVSASAGGNISPNEDVYLREGDSIRFSFLASTGYFLSDIIIDGISIGPKDTYDFVDIIDNHSIHADFTARPKIQVSVTIDGDGTVEPEGPINVNAGDDVQFAFSPGANHHVADVLINGQSKGPMNDLLLKNLNDNVVVTVNFMLGDFHIQASCDENGSITPNGWISAYLNDNQSFEIAPDPGYVIDKVQVNGAYIDPVAHFTFWNIADHHRIHATFRPKMVIMAASSDNGAIVPSGTIKVETGTFKKFEMVPDDGYRVSDVLVDGISHGPIEKYTFFNIQSGHTIEAIFVRDIFTIEATSGPYGSIVPEGNIAVAPGNFQFFEFNPDHGFRVASVAVDGEDLGAINQYYFENIDQNHTINVQFEPARIIVQAVAGDNGNIYPSGAVVVAEGGSQEFQIQPDMGYTIQNVKVDDKNLGKLDTFVFEDLAASHTIEAVFEPMLIIQASALENGSISPTDQIYVPKGEDQSIVITPDDGYVIDTLVVDGSPIAPNNIHVFWNVTQSHTILASFRRFQLTATANLNGSITPSGQMQVNKGHDQTFVILPNDGYTIADVIVDQVSQGPVDRFTFWDIQTDHDISASFMMRPRHTIVATADEGGIITPSGTLAFLEGDYPEFIIIPSTEYKITDVQVNETSIGPVTNYIFPDLQADAAIHVLFEILPKYTIQATSNTGGTISPGGEMTVVAGEFISFEITPDPDYLIESVFVDNIDFGPVRSYPMLADGDHQIVAQFVKHETRSISGHIYDLEQPDLPLSGFQIKVWQNDRLQGTAISDDNGLYEVGGLPVAADLIVAAWPPANDTTYQGLYYINQQSMQNANRVIVLANDLTGIDLFMPKMPVEGFTGQVHDRMDGIANIDVHATARDNSHSTSATTDADGYYQIIGLYPDRHYRISAHSDNFETDFFFNLTDNQTPGIDSPTSSTTSANLAKWLLPTTPLLKHIDIVFDPDSGDSISGHVSINGKPVTGMTVHAWSPNLRIGSSTTTDSSGAYVLKNLAPVSEIDAATEGYLVEIISDDYVYQSVSSVASNRSDVDFQLANQVAINGQITDIYGEPIANVLIQAVSSHDPWHKTASAASDHSGNYTLILTPAPDYVISASKSNYIVQYYNQADTSENATAVNACTITDTQIDFQLNSGAFIQGDIFVGTKTTKAPEGVLVTIRSDITNFVGQCKTDALGHYVMWGLDDAISDYQIKAQFNDNMPVYYADNGDTDIDNDSVYNRKYAGSVQPSEINRNLILLPGYRIRGQIMDDHVPVYGIKVDAFSEITGGWGRMFSQDMGAYQYEISGLPPGIYTVNVSGKDYQTITRAVTLVRQTTYLDFVLQPPDRKISGVIYGVDKGDILWIKAMSLNLGVEKSLKLEGTDAALPFTIDQLQSASDYILYVYGNDYPQTFYPDQPGIETAQSIDLLEGNADNIVFHLPEKASRKITGIVQFYSTFANGETVRITARSESGHHEKTISFVYHDDMIKQYAIEGLIPANDYLIMISSNTCVDMYYPDALSIDQAKPVNTMSGDAEGINFEMSPGSSIAGQISVMTGHDIHIFATAINLDVQAETIPASDGSFIIDGLSISDYILSAHIQDVGVFYYHPDKTVRDASESTALSVADGSISNITFSISDLHTISGSIKSEKGNALANVFVTCHSKSLNFGASTYSNESGYYEIEGVLQSTDYIVTATGSNKDDDFHTSLSHQNISAGDTQVNFVLQAQDAFEINGQIVNSMNQPLQQVVVEIQASDNSNHYDRAQTDIEGYFTLQGLPKGSNYILWVWPKSDMPYAYYRATQIDIPNPNFFQITLKTASDFGGIIRDDYSRDAISDAEITVFSEQTGFFQTTQSNSAGVYTITNAPLARDYRIVVQHQLYLDQEYSGQSPHTQLNFDMPASGCIYGELNSSETGSPVSDATVSVFSKAYDSAPDYIGTAQSDINGQFEVCNLRTYDTNGLQVNDYQLDVTAMGYPIQNRGGLRVGTRVDLLMESNPQYELSGKIDNTLDLNFILKIFDENSRFIQSTRIENNEFHVSGLNPEAGYRINVKAWEAATEPVIDAWVAASGRLVDYESDGKLFAAGEDVNIILTGRSRNKRPAITHKKGPGPVRDLRCLTHPYVTVNNRLRNMASAIPSEVTNRPNVAMTWDPPDGDDVEGYYYSFNQQSAHTINEFNTLEKPPVRTRKITSRDLEGDDVSYYFHVAAVDKEGRVGDTISIAFRIDTQAPINITVFLPPDTLTRDVSLSLGASGAAEMYISNVSYSIGGIWERLKTSKQWQLSGEGGSKKIFVGFRDRAKNMSETFGHTILNVGTNEHTITIKANAYGSVSPTQIVVNDKDSPVIEITPNDGYQVSRMTLDDRAVQYAGNGYIFSPVTDDHTLSVTFGPIAHMVYISSSDNGIVIPAGPVAVEHDHSLELEFQAVSGFALSHITVDGTPHAITGQTYQLEHIQEDIHLTAHFKPAYTISATAGSNGNVEPKTASVFNGKSQSFTFVPSPGYGVSKLWVDDIETPIQGNRYTFYNIDGNHTLYVQFQTAQYEIIALSGANGSISPKGTISVSGMGEKVFQISPDDGYQIDQVLVDDTPVTISDNSYKLENIDANHKIFAIFRRLNYPPQVNSATETLNEDQRFNGKLIASDPNDNDTITFAISSQPIHGSINLNTETGDYVYQPSNNYNGTDTFQYMANDGLVSSETATIDFNILPVNDAPEAHSETLSAKEDMATLYTLTATDVDHDSITYEILSLPEKGLITLTDAEKGYCVFRPFDNVVGRDEFTFKVTDGHLDSNTATIQIIINNENDPPVIESQHLTIEEDTPYTIVLSVNDPENDPLFFQMLLTGQNGNSTITDPIKGTVIYTPKPDVSGDDYFVYSVTDNQSEAQAATVTVTIKPVNDPPVALQQQIDIFANASMTITLTAYDIDSPAAGFTYELIETPRHGYATGKPPSITYQPNNNYIGLDQLTFAVHDNEGKSATGIIKFNILSPPDAIGTEDHDLSIDLPVYVVMDTPPQFGELIGTPPNVIYRPIDNFFGKDTFTYKINDQEKTFVVYISPVNDAPLAAIINPAPPLQTNENVPLVIDINIVDVDDDELQVSWEQPAHGSVTGNASQIVYSPYPSYSGKDSFWVDAFDGYVTTRLTIDIHVGKVNKAPIATNRMQDGLEDQSMEIFLQAMDPDNDSISYTIATFPSHGSLSGTLPSVIYLPNENYHGPDAFGFTASDGVLTSNIGLIQINILPQNDAPIALNSLLDVIEDQHAVSNFLANDIDQDALTFEIIQNGQLGEATLSNSSTGEFTYTPFTNAYGVDMVQFQVMDALSQSNVGQVSITIAPVNDSPTAQPAQFETDEDIPFDAMLIAHDIDIDQLQFNIVDSPQLGHIDLAQTGHFSYTPFENTSGQDQFTFKVQDAHGAQSISTQVIIDIHAINDAPVAQPFLIQLDEDSSFSDLLHGFDVDSSSLTYSIVTSPQKGTVELLNPDTGKFVYMPHANISGDDNFTYELSDGVQHSEIANVSVWITPVNDMPVIESQNIEIEQDQQAHIILMAEDADNDALNYNIITMPEHGSASIDGAGINYEPVAGFLGVDTLTVNAFDGLVNSKTATIQIWIGIHQVDIILTEDETIDIELPEQVSVVQMPEKGIITQAEGHYVYRPNENEFGYDVFYFKAASDSSSVSRTIFIKPVNDPPSITVQDSFIITEDQDYQLQVEIFDPETPSDQLITSVTDAPDHANIQWVGQWIHYHPFSDYNGDDSFTIQVSDGFENSFVSRTIQITIAPSNDVPRPIAQTVNMFEDQSKEFQLSATDLENDPITYAIYETTHHGTITGKLPDLIYTPVKDYFGKDYVYFTASDSEGTSQPQTITIVILGTQDRPVAFDSTLEVPQDVVQVSGQLFASDPDNDLLIYSIVTQPGKGHANLTNPTQGTFLYTPNPGMSGEDLLTFHVSDNYETSNLGLVTIQIADSTLLYHQLNITIMGDYLEGDSYGYSIVNTQSNVIVKKDQVNTKQISLFLPENEYSFHFSGDQYQSLAHPFDLMADMAIPITVKNNPDVFRLAINLQGDYIADESVTVNIRDANTDKILQTISTSTPLISTRWIAGIYKFSVQGDNYEPYQSAAIYLDKDKTIEAALIRKSETQLTINLTGDYQNGDPYAYKVINAANGLIVRQGQNNIQTLSVLLGQGNYRILIIADNYDPHECEYNDQKLIHFEPDMQIQAPLTQSSFTPEAPFVGVSYQRTDEGLDMRFHPENFTDGITITLNNSTIASNTNQSVSYQWKKSNPGMTPIVIDDDSHYALYFEFFHGNNKVEDYAMTYIDYGSETSEINNRSEDQKSLEQQYGDAESISNAHKTFYPLIGTTLSIQIENTLGEEQTLDIHIPPIPLDYLFIDNSTSETSGQMMYKESDDRYRILSTSTDKDLHPEPGQKLSVIIHHYSFAQSAGSGAMVSFEMAEGKFAGARVRYNPIFPDGRLSEIYNEAPPEINVPLILNKESSQYEELNNDLTGTDTRSFLIGERGDGFFGLTQTDIQFEKVNNVVYLMMTHLTIVGFDIEKDPTPEPEPELSKGGDSGGGCFIEACLFGP